MNYLSKFILSSRYSMLHMEAVRGVSLGSVSPLVLLRVEMEIDLSEKF